MRRAAGVIGAGLAAGWMVLALAGAAGATSHEEPAAASEASAEVDVEAEVPHTGASPDSPSAADEPQIAHEPDRYPELDVPTQGWAYDTSYYFALTRGLDEEDLSTTERRLCYVGTVPLDVLTLPGAVLAGFWGT